MITAITREVHAQERANTISTNHSYVTGLWAFAQRMAAHGFEPPDQTFQLQTYARSIYLRYGKMILTFSFSSVLRGYPTFQAIAASHRRTYFGPLPATVIDDTTFAQYVKMEIAGLTKARLTSLVKNSDQRWEHCNTDYRAQANNNR